MKREQPRYWRWFLALNIVALLLGGAWWGANFWAKRAVERRIVSRLGGEARVGRVRISPLSVTIEDLRWVTKKNHPADSLEGDSAFNVSVKRVAIGGSPLELLRHGARAAVHVEECEIEVRALDEHRNEIHRVIEALLRKNQPSHEASTTSPDSEIALKTCEIRVDDEAGTLIHASLESATKSSSRAHLATSFLALGDERPGRERAVFQTLEATATRTNERWKLSEASIAESLIVGITEESRGAAPALKDRLRALLSLVKMERSDIVTASDAQEQSSFQRALERMTDDVAMRAAQLTISLAANEQDETVLEAISGAVVRKGPNTFSLRGAGGRASERHVEWNFDVTTDSLRAEGELAFEHLPLAFFVPFLPGVPWFKPEEATVDARLQLTAKGATHIVADGMLRVENASLLSEKIASTPVRGISFTATGHGTFDVPSRHLQIDASRLQVGRGGVDLNGVIEWAKDHYRFDLMARMPRTPCDDVIGMLPRDFLQDVSGFELEGSMSAEAKVFVDSRTLGDTHVEVRVHDQCAFTGAPQIADLHRFDGIFTHRVIEPDGTTFEMETGPGSSNWVPIAAISPFLVHAVLAHEDAGFFTHHGFVPSQFQVALARNLEAGRYVQGASTITMQLVKNVFLHREKTLARKAQEAILTWWIERTWTKDRILELYLNVIEYGPAIYGIRNASVHYFGREPAELSLPEASFLANILPNPKLYHAAYDEGKLSARMALRVQGLMQRMFNKGRIDQIALDAGLAELPAFHFHHDTDPPEPVRELQGSVATLPIPIYEGEDAPEQERSLEVNAE